MELPLLLLPRTLVERGEGSWAWEDMKSIWAPTPMFQVKEEPGEFFEIEAGPLSGEVKVRNFYYTNPYTDVSLHLTEAWTTYDVYEDPNQTMIFFSPPPGSKNDKAQEIEDVPPPEIQESAGNEDTSEIRIVIHNPIVIIHPGLQVVPRCNPNRVEILHMELEFASMHFAWETAFVLAELAHRLQGCILIGETADEYETYVFHPPVPDAPLEKSTLAHLVRKIPFSVYNYTYPLAHASWMPPIRATVCPLPSEGIEEMARRILSYFSRMIEVEWPVSGNWENTHQTPFDRYSLWWRYMFRYPESARHNIPEDYYPLLVVPVRRVEEGTILWDMETGMLVTQPRWDQSVYFAALWETNYKRVFIPAWVHYVAFTPRHQVHIVEGDNPVLQCRIPPFAYNVHELVQALRPKALRIQGGWLCERSLGEAEGRHGLKNITVTPVERVSGRAIHHVAP